MMTGYRPRSPEAPCRRVIPSLVLLLAIALPRSGLGQGSERVGLTTEGGLLVATGQLLRPAGASVVFPGRPVDLALVPDGQTLYAKDDRGLVVLNVPAWRLLQELPFAGKKIGGSMHGLAVHRDGQRVYATTAQQGLHEAEVLPGGTLAWKRSIFLSGPDGKAACATGLTLSADGSRAFVCLSRNNSLGVVDLAAGKLVQEIAVGVAPYAVALSRDGSRAYVSNWGGRRPAAGERTALSSGTPTLVDERGIACSGTVVRVHLGKGEVEAETAVGLHPAGLVLARDEARLYVANANSDTVSVLDPRTMRLEHTVLVRPDPGLPFGSGTNAVALSPDGRTLYAANAGNNAVAVLAVGEGRTAPVLVGFVPTGWYPGAVVADDGHVFVANVKGEGSRSRPPGRVGWQVSGFRGSITKVPVPDALALARYTTQVRADGRVPQILRALERAQTGAAPVPVPRRPGDPSVFEHVVYVIKENRTYDQVLGDLKEGNGDPSLCIYGEAVTPNHHALARQFVLLDNYYCNGVCSADGHAWATEGHATDYLEKAFGGFTRSYPWGDDPLSYSSSGFLWDNALLHGLTFRNYGEMDYAEPVPKDATFAEIYQDYRAGQGRISFRQSIGIDTLRRYTAPGYPGWNLKITDVQRVDGFIKELRAAERSGKWPNLVLVLLPQDHTSGTSPDQPTPRAHLADNDLALGRLVEAVSHSRFWPTTCLFVIEDDPQDGFDHVDGHRSLCLVVSPYTKRKQVVSQFNNQTAVLHTIERILGLPPMNQMDALAPLLDACFTAKPDATPYEARPARAPLDEVNKKLSQLDGQDRTWAVRSQALDFSRADRADDDVLNRILWHAARGGDTPYPAHLAGGHGRGLEALKLRRLVAGAHGAGRNPP
jgi:YVTN family beta-propeller protein